jgi:hypothetical protein
MRGGDLRGASHRGLGSMKGRLSSDGLQGVEGLSVNSSSRATVPRDNIETSQTTSP